MIQTTIKHDKPLKTDVTKVGSMSKVVVGANS